MIKTVKVKKKLRLDELIKYVFDNEVTLKEFHSLSGAITVHVSNISGVRFDIEESSTVRFIHDYNIFTVEEEEEITEDTVFDSLIEITADGGYIDHGYNISVSDVKGQHSIRFYTLINKKLQLIWEAE